MSISDQDLDVLTSLCHKLVKASSSLDVWTNSIYGSTHHMCSTHTLAELRRFWLSYATFPSISPNRKEHLRQERIKLVERAALHVDNPTFSRSAGMVWPIAMEPVKQLVRRFWTTGTTFLSEQDVKAARNMNPTFCYNQVGETFSPHYGTSLASAFHLLPVFSTNRSSALTDGIRKQFDDWCSAFRDHSQQTENSLVLRYCVADALSFSHALAHRQRDGGSFPCFVNAKWTMNALDMDSEGTPTAFDIIDTSNLIDHLGLLNLLMAAEPLLRRCVWSTIHTEALIGFGEDMTASVEERICGDIPTMSMLLGLAPRAMLAGFSSHSNIHELLQQRAGLEQYHERIAWSRPCGEEAHPSQFAFSPQDLGKFLFGVYDRMFRDERTADASSNTSLINVLGHHNRASFAHIVWLMKSRISASDQKWSAAMDLFHDLVCADRRRILGTNFYQDLFLQLHRFGLYSTPVLVPTWKDQAIVRHPVDTFQGWKSVPSVVCVVLVVPRDKFLPVLNTQGIRSIPLHCHTRHSGGQTSFFSGSLQIAPGYVYVTPGHPPSVTIEEDPKGFSGLKDAQSLVVSVLVPSWALTLPDTRIALALKATPSTVSTFMRRLGSALEIFSASITDQKHVHIVPQRPNLTHEMSAFSLPPIVLPDGSAGITYTVQLDTTCSRITTITAEVDISAGRTQPLAADEKVWVEQTSPNIMSLFIGEEGEEVKKVQFVYPVRGANHRLRIARKSLYVEIVVPLSRFQGGRNTGGYAMNPFQVMATPNPSSWSLHNIHLDLMPTIDVTNARRSDLDWIHVLSSVQFSDREKLALKMGNLPETEVVTNMKESLHMVFSQAAGINPPSTPRRMFQLWAPEVGVFMILFVCEVRLDPASFSFVADMAVVPLDITRTEEAAEGIFALMNGVTPQNSTTITLTEVEAVGWKQLIPACVERCRTWSHSPNCEYKAPGARIPLSVEVEFAYSPICTCGRGIGLPERLSNVPKKAWAHFRPMAIRAAISPLFAVSYLDRVAGPAADFLGEQQQARTNLPTSSFSSAQRPPKSQAKLGTDSCTACGGPGNPKLLACGRCKRTKYCSSACSKAHWKKHKQTCTSN